MNVHLMWDHAETRTRAAIAKYEVAREPARPVLEVSYPNRMVDDRNVAQGTYTYRVRAVASDGQVSAYSAPVAVTVGTPPTDPPGAPTNLVGTASNTNAAGSIGAPELLVRVNEPDELYWPTLMVSAPVKLALLAPAALAIPAVLTAITAVAATSRHRSAVFIDLK
jgi:hypothetical protein